MNVYGFAGGDPVSYADPYGLCAKSRRDSADLCPGGLTVTEWQRVEAAASWMTGSARRKVLRQLNWGNIRKQDADESIVAQVKPSYEPGVIYFNPNSGFGNTLLTCLQATLRGF
jgi:hypothetical protein